MDYLTIESHNCEEKTIKKSKFIVNCFFVEDVNQVEMYLKKVKKQHYKATHNTYAYVLGEEKDVQKYSDDGEPSGTAGRPILEAILQMNLTNTLVVVTRYFGGIKLGAGGLIRAYHTTALLGLESAMIIKMQKSSLLEILIDYPLLGNVQTYLSKNNFNDYDASYEDVIKIRVNIPFDDKDKFVSDIVELTNDNVEIKFVREQFVKTKAM